MPSESVVQFVEEIESELKEKIEYNKEVWANGAFVEDRDSELMLLGEINALRGFMEMMKRNLNKKNPEFDD